MNTAQPPTRHALLLAASYGLYAPLLEGVLPYASPWLATALVSGGAAWVLHVLSIVRPLEQTKRLHTPAVWHAFDAASLMIELTLVGYGVRVSGGFLASMILCLGAGFAGTWRCRSPATPACVVGATSTIAGAAAALLASPPPAEGLVWIVSASALSLCSRALRMRWTAAGRSFGRGVTTTCALGSAAMSHVMAEAEPRGAVLAWAPALAALCLGAALSAEAGVKLCLNRSRFEVWLSAPAFGGVWCVLLGPTSISTTRTLTLSLVAAGALLVMHEHLYDRRRYPDE